MLYCCCRRARDFLSVVDFGLISLTTTWSFLKSILSTLDWYMLFRFVGVRLFPVKYLVTMLAAWFIRDPLPSLLVSKFKIGDFEISSRKVRDLDLPRTGLSSLNFFFLIFIRWDLEGLKVGFRNFGGKSLLELFDLTDFFPESLSFLEWACKALTNNWFLSLGFLEYFSRAVLIFLSTLSIAPG